jgi:dTDP-4-dehydrorhamnose reductase
LRLYVIGAEGQVARALREAAAKHPDVVFGYGCRPDLDIRCPELVEKALATFSPDIVVNPAAYTAVDRAESEVDLAFAVNRDGAGNVATAAAQLGIPIIHLSTDFVFDGKKQGRYVETDSVAPVGVYGQSKLAGEYSVAQANNRHVILRTSWVFAPFGNNFLRTILRLSTESDRLTVVNDQVGCPTYAPDIADAIISVARQIVSLGWQDSFAGITHLAGPDEVSWYGFAHKILRVSEKKAARSIVVDAISTADYPTAARRPVNSGLCCDRLASIFRIALPSLESSLERCLEYLLETPASDDGAKN